MEDRQWWIGDKLNPIRATEYMNIENRVIPSLDYQQEDVREALEALFNSVGAFYTIAPNVQGQVTVALRNITFANALQSILRQVDAVYRIEAGVYEITRREEG